MFGRLKDFTRKLRAGADAAIRSEAYLKRLVQLRLMQDLAATERFKDPRRLLSAGLKVYSQNDEDGMIAEVFRRIGTADRRFIEFGVEDGLESNSTYLLLQGWSGAWIDGSAVTARRAQAAFKDYPVEVVTGHVTAENADELIGHLAGTLDLDLLSIDIDSNDYWVWKAIQSTRPRLVVIEYNATLPPPLRKTIAYAAAGAWDGSNYFGASLSALEALGREKGYCLVGCSLSGTNAFFVRDDLVGDHFCAPFTAENHYEPARYVLTGSSGHRPGIGRWVDV
jgi:hypothetical protein